MSVIDSGREFRLSMSRSLKRARAKVTWRKSSLEGVPIIFGNAMPKSGSKLLLQVLGGLSRIGPFVLTGRGPVRTITIDGRSRSSQEIQADLDRLEPGDIGWGYLRATPENMDYLRHPGWASYFILRDPRDMLVSHVYYATDMYEGHGMHEIYTRLPNMDERLKVAICGVQEGEHHLPDVAERYQRMAGWLECPEVMLLHFEDFILDRESTISAMLDHLERAGYTLPLDRQTAIHRIAQAIDPKRSPTFRKGRVGDWREHFNDKNKTLFKEVAGDLLVRLGYEPDNNW